MPAPQSQELLDLTAFPVAVCFFFMPEAIVSFASGLGCVIIAVAEPAGVVVPDVGASVEQRSAYWMVWVPDFRSIARAQVPAVSNRTRHGGLDEGVTVGAQIVARRSHSWS